jgi:hypothetical protein
MIAFQSAFVVQTWLLPFNVTMPSSFLYPCPASGRLPDPVTVTMPLRMISTGTRSRRDAPLVLEDRPRCRGLRRDGGLSEVGDHKAGLPGHLRRRHSPLVLHEAKSFELGRGEIEPARGSVLEEHNPRPELLRSYLVFSDIRTHTC